MIVFTISVFLELDQSNLACVGVSVWLNNSTSQSRAGAERLPILEYHDLTLSRFSRYVWEAVDLARLPCSSATVCPYLHSQSRPGFWWESPLFCNSHRADFQRKSKWWNRPSSRAGSPWSCALIGRGWRGLAQFAAPGMWKWLREVVQDSVFAAYLVLIVSGWCSVVRVTDAGVMR